MGMFLDICNFCKAVFTDLGNLLDVYPKKKGPFIHKPDDKPTQWGADSYEPWDFLTEEQWEEILRGEKSLEDFTMSHVWPPEKEEDNAIETKQEDASAEDVEQENEQGQNSGSKDAESGENLEGSDELGETDSTSESDSGAFESDGSESDFDSDSDGSSPGSDGYIG